MKTSRSIQELVLLFRDRAKPIVVPVTEEEAGRIRNGLDGPHSTGRGFFDVHSLVGHDIRVNCARLQAARFLVGNQSLWPGTFPFNPASIAPSKHRYPDDTGKEPDLMDVLWNVTLCLRGLAEPLKIDDLCGYEWIDIFTSLEQGKSFFIVTDEDDEEIAVRVDEIDMVSGIELERYSDEQLGVVLELIKF